MQFVQQIDGAWVPAQWPYRDAEGCPWDSLDMIAEKPGALAAAGYYPSRFDKPDGVDVISWDTGSLAGDEVVFRPAETQTAAPVLTFDEFAKMATASGLAAKAKDLSEANPGVIAAWVLVQSFGYREALARMSQLGAKDLPTIEELHGAAEVAKAEVSVEMETKA